MIDPMGSRPWFIVQHQGPRPRMEDAAFVSRDTLIVCDGMGGMADGHVASTVAVAMARSAPSLAAIRANGSQHLLDAVGRHSGTTLTVARVRHGLGVIEWLHCGDSALWLLPKDRAKLVRLTKSHTVWDAQREAGDEHPDRGNKSRLLSCLPMPYGDVRWDEGHVVIPPGGAWLVGTTDGFHDAVEDGDGYVYPAVLHARICELLSLSEADTADRMGAAAESTRDNATLACLHLPALGG